MARARRAVRPLRPNPRSAHPPVPRRATTLGQVYADQGAIVTDALHASNLIGATPTGRPEDIEVHPIDRSVYIAFTSAATAPGHLFPNLYGEIWRIEDDAEGAGARFTWMRWKAGGPNDPSQAGHVFAAPDNLSFDPAGHLWIVTDITSSRLNAHPGYTAFANNGMFFVPASGPDAGIALQFASGAMRSRIVGAVMDDGSKHLVPVGAASRRGVRHADRRDDAATRQQLARRPRQSAATTGGCLDPRPLTRPPAAAGLRHALPEQGNRRVAVD